jgi:Ca2+-binding RTX toxin-like protein
MVLKFIDGNSNGDGDLFNLADHYGLEDDAVFVAMAPGPYATDTIKTYGGDDVVIVSGTTSVDFIVNVFELGSGNDKLIGGNGSEEYRDQSGDDIIFMGGGNDFVFAGTGYDTIDGGDGIDTVSFDHLRDPFGVPLAVENGVTFDLAVTGQQLLGDFGIDSFKNFENVLGTGKDDVLFGTSAANDMGGSDGADVLNGRAGNDVLKGGRGADTLVGGLGGDDLWGHNGNGAGGDGAADTFSYFSVAESSLLQPDIIWDFEDHVAGGMDKIDLSAMDASTLLRGNNTFVFVGTSAFSSAQGEVSRTWVNGDTIVRIDTDGDADAEMMIIFKGIITLTADDFVF